MKKNTLLLSVIMITLAGSIALASSGGGFDSHAKQMVIFQTINVAIFLGILVYFGKKKNLAQVFQNRRNEFLQKFEKIQVEKRKVESQNFQIKHQLAKLEEGHQETIVRARAEAADLKEKLLMEANQIAQKIKQEALKTTELEIEKAKRAIRQEMIVLAMQQAKEQLATKVSAEDHKRLQGHFISNIGAQET